MGSICAGQRWRDQDHQERGGLLSIWCENERGEYSELVLEVIFNLVVRGWRVVDLWSFRSAGCQASSGAIIVGGATKPPCRVKEGSMLWNTRQLMEAKRKR